MLNRNAQIFQYYKDPTCLSRVKELLHMLDERWVVHQDNSDCNLIIKELQSLKVIDNNELFLDTSLGRTAETYHMNLLLDRQLLEIDNTSP